MLWLEDVSGGAVLGGERIDWKSSLTRLHRLRRAEARCDPDGAACPITGSREGLRAAGFCAL